MHAQGFLHKMLKKALTGVHKLRAEALITLAESTLFGARLTLTDLGRHIKGQAKVKHKIKRSDRLLGNKNLLAERRVVYSELCRYFFRVMPRLEILVDWSGCCSPDRHILQASVVYQGRSIPIYRELHSKKKQQTQGVHDKFLEHLKEIIPEDREVVIVTDSGFQTPWFKKVRSLGWHFVGRLSSRIDFCLLAGGEAKKWQSVKNLKTAADGKPRRLGRARLGSSIKEPLECFLMICKEKKRGRRKASHQAQVLYPEAEKRYKSLSKRPWVLVSSEKDDSTRASITKNIYGRRMQIEQNFRDEKNPRWGLGMRVSRTKNMKRLEILLLIGLIGQYLLWLIGMTAEYKQLHRAFQSNSEKSSRVSAFITLAKQVVYHGFAGLKSKDFRESMQYFSDNYEKIVLC
jgi:hypothetical protein